MYLTSEKPGKTKKGLLYVCVCLCVPAQAPLLFVLSLVLRDDSLLPVSCLLDSASSGTFFVACFCWPRLEEKR